MDCRNFEEIVGELACDRLVEAAIRKSALVHAAVCGRCAVQLDAQRALNAGLLEFAEATGREHAAPRLKRELHAALAERKVAKAATIKAAPVVAITPAGKPISKQSWPRWALAAAAAILALFTITVMLWQRSAPRAQEGLEGGAKPAPSATQPLLMPAPFARRDHIAQIATIDPAASGFPHRAPRRRSVIDRAGDESEIVSEFVPLTIAGDARDLQDALVVRVEVPRSKLIALGLPLNVERDRETVKADVLMGDNGVAYAIRLVR